MAHHLIKKLLSETDDGKMLSMPTLGQVYVNTWSDVYSLLIFLFAHVLASLFDACKGMLGEKFRGQQKDYHPQDKTLAELCNSISGGDSLLQLRTELQGGEGGSA